MVHHIPHEAQDTTPDGTMRWYPIMLHRTFTAVTFQHTTLTGNYPGRKEYDLDDEVPTLGQSVNQKFYKHWRLFIACLN